MTQSLLGHAVEGSRQRGLTIRLDQSRHVEEVRAGRFVVINGSERQFFAMITDFTLQSSSPQAPVDGANAFTQKIPSGNVFEPVKSIPTHVRQQYFMTTRVRKFCLCCHVFVTTMWLAAGLCFAQAPSEQSPEPMPARLTNVPINAPIPSITIDAGDELVSGAGSTFSTNGSFVFTGGATVVGGTEFTVRADRLTGSLLTGVDTAEGHVSLRELNSYLDVDSLFASTTAQAGAASNILLRQAPYTIYAQRLTFQESEIDIYSAVLTTVPPTQASDYSIHAGRIVYQPVLHRITIFNGSFYLGSKRIFAFKKLSRKLEQTNSGRAGVDKLFSETFGYTGYLGPYIDYTSHFGQIGNGVTGTFTISEKQVPSILFVGRSPVIVPHSNHVATAPKTLLARLRQAVEATEPILPPGDPLLFHWFETQTTMDDRFNTIPNSLSVDATGVASYREMVFGHATDTLFYSRLPEASLNAVMPISGPRSLPTSHDPGQVRAALKQIALFAVVTPTIGRYYEYPDNVTSDRESIVTSLESRPILIGDNLLFKPTISYNDSTYPGHGNSFQIYQYDLALEQYRTDESGYGIEYTDSQERGESPFQFDTPYASRELDTRFQLGRRNAIYGIVLKYDLNNQSLFSEQLMIAPKLRSFIPRFTYDFRDSAFSVGFDISGLTY
jgi:hypothetical protein